MVSIDRAGRLVVPKELRDRLGVSAGTTFDATLDGDAIRLTPQRPAGRRVVEVDGWPVIEAGDSPITDADVQAWRDAGQR